MCSSNEGCGLCPMCGTQTKLCLLMPIREAVDVPNSVPGSSLGHFITFLKENPTPLLNSLLSQQDDLDCRICIACIHLLNSTMQFFSRKIKNGHNQQISPLSEDLMNGPVENECKTGDNGTKSAGELTPVGAESLSAEAVSTSACKPACPSQKSASSPIVLLRPLLNPSTRRRLSSNKNTTLTSPTYTNDFKRIFQSNSSASPPPPPSLSPGAHQVNLSQSNIQAASPLVRDKHGQNNSLDSDLSHFNRHSSQENKATETTAEESYQSPSKVCKETVAASTSSYYTIQNLKLTSSTQSAVALPRPATEKSPPVSTTQKANCSPESWSLKNRVLYFVKSQVLSVQNESYVNVETPLCVSTPVSFSHKTSAANNENKAARQTLLQSYSKSEDATQEVFLYSLNLVSKQQNTPPHSPSQQSLGSILTRSQSATPITAEQPKPQQHDDFVSGEQTPSDKEQLRLSPARSPLSERRSPLLAGSPRQDSPSPVRRNLGASLQEGRVEPCGLSEPPAEASNEGTTSTNLQQQKVSLLYKATARLATVSPPVSKTKFFQFKNKDKQPNEVKNVSTSSLISKSNFSQPIKSAVISIPTNVTTDEKNCDPHEKEVQTASPASNVIDYSTDKPCTLSVRPTIRFCFAPKPSNTNSESMTQKQTAPHLGVLNILQNISKTDKNSQCDTLKQTVPPNILPLDSMPSQSTTTLSHKKYPKASAALPNIITKIKNKQQILNRTINPAWTKPTQPFTPESSNANVTAPTSDILEKSRAAQAPTTSDVLGNSKAAQAPTTSDVSVDSRAAQAQAPTTSDVSVDSRAAQAPEAPTSTPALEQHNLKSVLKKHKPFSLGVKKAPAKTVRFNKEKQIRFFQKTPEENIEDTYQPPEEPPSEDDEPEYHLYESDEPETTAAYEDDIKSKATLSSESNVAVITPNKSICLSETAAKDVTPASSLKHETSSSSNYPKPENTSNSTATSNSSKFHSIDFTPFKDAVSNKIKSPVKCLKDNKFKAFSSSTSPSLRHTNKKKLKNKLTLSMFITPQSDATESKKQSSAFKEEQSLAVPAALGTEKANPCSNKVFKFSSVSKLKELTPKIFTISKNSSLDTKTFQNVSSTSFSVSKNSEEHIKHADTTDSKLKTSFNPHNTFAITIKPKQNEPKVDYLSKDLGKNIKMKVSSSCTSNAKALNSSVDFTTTKDSDLKETSIPAVQEVSDNILLSIKSRIEKPVAHVSSTNEAPSNTYKSAKNKLADVSSVTSYHLTSDLNQLASSKLHTLNTTSLVLPPTSSVPQETDNLQTDNLPDKMKELVSTETTNVFVSANIAAAPPSPSQNAPSFESAGDSSSPEFIQCIEASEIEIKANKRSRGRPRKTPQLFQVVSESASRNISLLLEDNLNVTLAVSTPNRGSLRRHLSISPAPSAQVERPAANPQESVDNTCIVAAAGKAATATATTLNSTVEKSMEFNPTSQNAETVQSNTFQRNELSCLPLENLPVSVNSYLIKEHWKPQFYPRNFIEDDDDFMSNNKETYENCITKVFNAYVYLGAKCDRSDQNIPPCDADSVTAGNLLDSEAPPPLLAASDGNYGVAASPPCVRQALLNILQQQSEFTGPGDVSLEDSVPPQVSVQDLNTPKVATKRKTSVGQADVSPCPKQKKKTPTNLTS